MLYTGCSFTSFQFPDEPGLLPDPSAQEQQLLWMVVGAVLLCVMFVKARSRLARGVPEELSGSRA